VRDIEANDIFLPFSISNCSLVLTKSNLRAPRSLDEWRRAIDYQFIRALIHTDTTR